MRLKRSTLVGASVGLALAMPLFEVLLLTILAIDGVWFDAVITIQYFTKSSNLIGLLILLHLVTGLTGAVIGSLLPRQPRRRKNLALIAGGGTRSR